jgi:hypothetical protein
MKIARSAILLMFGFSIMGCGSNQVSVDKVSILPPQTSASVIATGQNAQKLYNSMYDLPKQYGQNLPPECNRLTSNINQLSFSKKGKRIVDAKLYLRGSCNKVELTNGTTFLIGYDSKATAFYSALQKIILVRY